mmetsp:Transcript_23803/g.81348  ORF Transcript_23803/g.81348 Transcript_23803/m.81348 type:complete len:213 (-) Transcript_23803:595-1233(-)
MLFKGPFGHLVALKSRTRSAQIRNTAGRRPQSSFFTCELISAAASGGVSGSTSSWKSSASSSSMRSQETSGNLAVPLATEPLSSSANSHSSAKEMSTTYFFFPRACAVEASPLNSVSALTKRNRGTVVPCRSRSGRSTIKSSNLALRNSWTYLVWSLASKVPAWFHADDPSLTCIFTSASSFLGVMSPMSARVCASSSLLKKVVLRPCEFTL